MKSIMKEYGTLIIAVIAVAAILLVIMGTRGINLYHRMNQAAESLAPAMSAGGDSNAIAEFYQRTRPEITLCMYEEGQEYRAIHAEELVHLPDYFQAVSMEGESIEVAVIQVLDDTGATIEVEQEADVRFPRSGIYVAEVQARDRDGVTRNVQVQIPVMKKERREQVSEAGSMGSSSRSARYLYGHDTDDSIRALC